MNGKPFETSDDNANIEQLCTAEGQLDTNKVRLSPCTLN